MHMLTVFIAWCPQQVNSAESIAMAGLDKLGTPLSFAWWIVVTAHAVNCIENQPESLSYVIFAFQ